MGGYFHTSSTKGELNHFVERVVDYLEENYAVDRAQVLDPEHYKDYRDRVEITGKYASYIDYLISLGRLRR
jgi:hypothetical protein